MDPEFVRVTSRVLAIGLTIVTIGTVALFIAFRSFGRADERQDFRPFVMLLAAAFFILVLCVILLRWSFVAR